MYKVFLKHENISVSYFYIKNYLLWLIKKLQDKILKSGHDNKYN